LLPGAYSATVATWDQDFQEFNAPGPAFDLPNVDYIRAAKPAVANMSSVQLGNNRNWALRFAGNTRAQGFVIEVINRSNGYVQTIAEPFVPDQAGATVYPSAPTDPELARIYLTSSGHYQWRLRFYTPLDPPDTAGANWSDYVDVTTLNMGDEDEPLTPVLPPEADTGYFPEDGAVFNADDDTGTATVDFHWTAVQNADAYYVYVATAEGRVVVNRRLVSTAQLKGIGLSPGNYVWTVRPVNTVLGTDGIADGWMAPYPHLKVVPAANHDPGAPGDVVVSGQPLAAGDGYVRLPLAWTGHVGDRVRILILNPGVMLESEVIENPDGSFMTEQLPAHLAPGQTTLVKVQGIGAGGTLGPWSAFTAITIPPM
jgi:hypothetical protein